MLVPAIGLALAAVWVALFAVGAPPGWAAIVVSLTVAAALAALLWRPRPGGGSPLPHRARREGRRR